MQTTSWCVYDAKADEVIGVWNTYSDAEIYFDDHVDLFEGHLQLFPWAEYTVTQPLSL
jgi:hypothetical protein